MDPALHAWLRDHEGIVTSADAASLGLSNGDLCAAAARGELERVTRGSYVLRDRLTAGDPEQRHRLRLAAVLRRQPSHLVASHSSAALVWDLPVSYAHLDRVHVARAIARGTTRRYPRHTLHEGYAEGTATVRDGTPVVIAPLAVLGTAFLYGMRAGVLVADAALRSRVTTSDELCVWMERLTRTPGMMRARAAVERSHASAESPGESRLRLTLEDLGLRALPQFTILDEAGCFVARVDFYLPECGVVVEFDGHTKYGGTQGGAALVAEKQREDRIRALGYAVVRLTSSDVDEPSRVGRMVRRAASGLGGPRPA
ncbi:MAG TPA: type IV toxin-antitoxin system AbiEi family antitoxin domain-containing protein [Ornithinimicrobium sp.]|uniref:type IV toxin-antitoxin system AbiEi family antitoxin domain-containing protein n=1 Tax=Ornithinimicrobium sp. TaxID=1977084 RepID=UPI002B4886F3|nr:type IV toxin-antitoxin system AbiEi family antitoxin domain-containing protein [Ornithinimicrobium sp.]HKJ12065.1 type IV toxin-antitoxin system AbiEi family antitoxin domain-containing protein [Ornithinimicrobium sp.]